MLFAQEDGVTSSQNWNEMIQVNSNLKETNTIRIFDNPKKVYQLELKDNKPYNGYEISDEKLLGELNYVNFYQNGALVAKYAIDYLRADGTSIPVEYTLKTTYQDNNVISGPVYRELPQNLVLIEQYQEGKQVGFFLDLFAMHYFNRLSFQLKGDMLSITNLQTENEVRVYKKNESLEAEYYVRKKLIAKSKRSVEKKDQIVPYASKVYYVEGQALKEFICVIHTSADLEEVEDDFLPLLFTQFSFEFNGDLVDVLKICNLFFSDAENLKKTDLGRIFDSYIVPYKRENYLAMVNYDAKGQPYEGQVISSLTSGGYEVLTYENGALKDKSVISNLTLLKTEE
ncbi:hypothetical protein E2P86_08220 [Sphingobacterium psychroaquaticum]|nr:hypothetical protein E2P86_08220 [Sphingobacterium psychroaquaticum]